MLALAFSPRVAPRRTLVGLLTLLLAAPFAAPARAQDADNFADEDEAFAEDAESGAVAEGEAAGALGGTAEGDANAADPSELSETDREAHSLFLSGVTAVREGRYEQALRFFEASYELSGRPHLLYNIGHVADVLRMERRAAGAFRDYLAALPDAPNAASVRARLRIMERSIRSRQATEARADYFSELTEQEFDDAEVPSPADAARAGAPQAPEEESRPLYRDWRFWFAMIGTAVVAGSAAGIIAAAAR